MFVSQLTLKWYEMPCQTRPKTGVPLNKTYLLSHLTLWGASRKLALRPWSYATSERSSFEQHW